MIWSVPMGIFVYDRFSYIDVNMIQYFDWEKTSNHSLTITTSSRVIQKVSTSIIHFKHQMWLFVLRK